MNKPLQPQEKYQIKPQFKHRKKTSSKNYHDQMAIGKLLVIDVTAHPFHCPQ